MTEVFFDIFSGFRIQDLFDVLIIAILIYGVLIWFKKAASRFVLAGIVLLGLVYVLARTFHLYMTALALQGFFAILLLALVIIFQEELRRFFERLATLGWFGRTRRSISQQQQDADIIAQVASTLAAKRVGALFVLPAKGPVDRHIHSGIPLDGRISPQLLESIFDHHSPGHDGAVVIRNSKVESFGCHLPLSPNVDRIPYGGLRHTAAVGLSELTDALCVVVSEEKGVISVARGGRLQPIFDDNQLRDLLNSFFRPRTPRQSKRPLGEWVRQNTREKVMALLLASLLWVGFGQQRDLIERDFVLPIEYRNLPAQWLLEDPEHTATRVRLQGPRQAFRFAETETMKVSVDLSSLPEGEQEVVLSSDLVRIPPTLTLESIKPGVINLTLHRLYPTRVPIELRTTGSVPTGYTLVSATLAPTHATVLAIRENDAGRVRIATAPVDLSGVMRTVQVSPNLIYPADLRFVDGRPPQVSLTLTVQAPPQPTAPAIAPENNNQAPVTGL